MKNLLFVLMLALLTSPAWTSTTFTYQGQLSQGSDPFSGSINLEFRLFTEETGGSQIGDVVERPSWPVENGLFQVDLDFGEDAFSADPRYLEIRVRNTTLTPRQPVRPTPVAMYALEAAKAPATWPVDRGAPGDVISWTIFTDLDAIDALAATHDVTGRLVVAVRDFLNVHVLRCINIHCEGSDRTISSAAPDVANVNSPVDIMVGQSGQTFVAYGSAGNQLVIARCPNERCNSLQRRFVSEPLNGSIIDLSMVNQSNNRLAVVVTLSTGESHIFRCLVQSSASGCSDADRADVSAVAGATRISAASSSIQVPHTIIVATTHSDETLRINQCSTLPNSDCVELEVIENVGYEDGIHAQTTVNGLPVFAYYRNRRLHIARCTNSSCTDVESTSIGNLQTQDFVRQVIAGTLLPAGYPVFALSTNGSEVLQCVDAGCAGFTKIHSITNLQHFGAPNRAATVGPEGTLMLVGGSPGTNLIRTVHCTSGPACLPFFRPR